MAVSMAQQRFRQEEASGGKPSSRRRVHAAVTANSIVHVRQ
jgi:hypothetical protein